MFDQIRFGVDDIPYTLTLFEKDGSINYDNVSSFSAADYAFLFSYAQDLDIKNRYLEGLKVGLSTKVVHRRAGEFARSWGFGIDLGAQLSYKNWEFGLMARDITTTFNAWTISFTEEEKQVLHPTQRS